MPPALSLALSDHRAGRHEAAREAYERILREQPENPEATHFLGMLCHEQGRIEEALGLLELSPETPIAESFAIHRSG